MQNIYDNGRLCLGEVGKISQQLIDYAKNGWEKYKNMGFELNFIKKDLNNKWQTNKDFFKFKNSQLF